MKKEYCCERQRKPNPNVASREREGRTKKLQAHVVGTILNREQDRLLVLLGELDHKRLLQRRRSTYTVNDRFTQQYQLQKPRLGSLLSGRKYQTFVLHRTS